MDSQLLRSMTFQDDTYFILLRISSSYISQVGIWMTLDCQKYAGSRTFRHFFINVLVKIILLYWNTYVESICLHNSIPFARSFFGCAKSKHK